MNQQKPVVQRSDLQKTAEMLLQLKDQRMHLQKEARATELLYKQAEMGQISFPKTHAQYREKLAQLLDKDLNVVEEAIKMASSAESFNQLGGLDNSVQPKNTPQQMFQKTILS